LKGSYVGEAVLAISSSRLSIITLTSNVYEVPREFHVINRARFGSRIEVSLHRAIVNDEGLIREQTTEALRVSKYIISCHPGKHPQKKETCY
jgi:hypothetical protein